MLTARSCEHYELSELAKALGVEGDIVILSPVIDGVTPDWSEVFKDDAHT